MANTLNLQHNGARLLAKALGVAGFIVSLGGHFVLRNLSFRRKFNQPAQR